MNARPSSVSVASSTLRSNAAPVETTDAPSGPGMVPTFSAKLTCVPSDNPHAIPLKSPAGKIGFTTPRTALHLPAFGTLKLRMTKSGFAPPARSMQKSFAAAGIAARTRAAAITATRGKGRTEAVVMASPSAVWVQVQLEREDRIRAQAFPIVQ